MLPGLLTQKLDRGKLADDALSAQKNRCTTTLLCNAVAPVLCSSTLCEMSSIRIFPHGTLKTSVYCMGGVSARTPSFMKLKGVGVLIKHGAAFRSCFLNHINLLFSSFTKQSFNSFLFQLALIKRITISFVCVMEDKIELQHDGYNVTQYRLVILVDSQAIFCLSRAV